MKTAKHLTVVFLLLLLNKTALSQIHWADRIVFQHNPYSESEFSASELLGPPDAFPYGKMSNRAFRLNHETAYGIATVGFKKPIHVSQIIIAENFLPNHIAKVILKDEGGKEHLIYEPKPGTLNIPFRLLTVNIEKTPYKVAGVSVHLNTYSTEVWAQIDAIGISENIQSEKQLSKIIKHEQFSEDETIRFVDAREKLSPNINTKYNEAKPILSPNGKTLYFVRKFYPGNFDGKSDHQDIYYSEFINGRWTVAQNIGAPLNDEYPNGICSISPDGNTVYVLNAYENEAGLVLDGISSSTKLSDGKWSMPEQLKIVNFYNRNEFQDYSVSASGNTLLLAIERDDSQGDQDLYVSFRKEDCTWTEPVSLGRTINTEMTEYSPHLSLDEKTLFFASNGHTADSKGDIYYAKRLDDTWLNWSKPVNIGYEVNTNGIDAYFSIGPKNKYAYFVSSEDSGRSAGSGSGNLDIYRIPLSIEPEPEKTFAISGKLFNTDNNDAVFGKVMINSVESPAYKGFSVSNVKTGDYNMKMPVNGSYELYAEADGFITYRDTITLSEREEAESFMINIPMEPIAKGHKFALDNLFFIQSKAEMLPESEPELERLYSLLTQNPSIEIELSGHTDNEGYRSSNVKLSQERAEAVKEYLVLKGVDKRRIQTVGFGPTQPVASNDTEENRAKNRRVEVEITSVK